jgi:hypothetical protein
VSTRNSIPRALAAFVLVLAADPLAAQQAFTPPAGVNGEIVAQAVEREKQVVPSDTGDGFTKKSGAVAVGFGYLIPGGGQIYTAKYGKGIALFGVSVGAIALADASCGGVVTETCVGNSLLALAVVLGAWGYGMASAPGDAREYNEKHAGPIVVEPMLDRHAGRAGLGLALRY